MFEPNARSSTTSQEVSMSIRNVVVFSTVVGLIMAAAFLPKLKSRISKY
jgi:hypothetical protein